MMPHPFSSIRLRIATMVCALFLTGALTASAATARSTIECTVYPAVPDRLVSHQHQALRVRQNGQNITLENGFISVLVRNGVIVSLENKLTGENYPIESDETGFSLADAQGQKIEWFARNGAPLKFEVELKNGAENCTAILKTKKDATAITLTYTLAKNQFWVERHLSVESGKVKYDQLRYGKAEIPKGQINELKLGKFDSPRLVSIGKGGLFFGVGWWYYEINDGVYQNSGMNYHTEGRFEAEPWYVGVFQPEAGEPYPGWFWYKTFLQERKLAYDKQSSFFLWNARNGYAFSSLNDPELLTYLGTVTNLGLNGITAGEVRYLAKATKLAATDPAARKVIDGFAEKGVVLGVHDGDVGVKNWRSQAGLASKLEELNEATQQKIQQLSIDFFHVDDHFADHRRVTEFFRAVRSKMTYSECHLGMAAYGPQCQREVLINHPTDLKGFDMSRFSSDWATLLGFRQSRREWQQKYQYLMPENGLFYFCTHYSNLPRTYQDPEPQQFLFSADARRGLAYAFQDEIGFRDSVAAQAAFSTFYVFGFLPAQMSARDTTFTHDYLAWVKTNSNMLNRSRVCFETADALVMSKIRDGRGAIFVLNYTPGEKQFKMKLEIPDKKAISIRQVFPTRGKMVRYARGETLETEIGGERLAIFEVNNGLNGLPPENPSDFPIDFSDWRRTGENFQASAVIPEVRANLARQKNSSLPKRIVSADQEITAAPRTRTNGMGIGKPPKEFLDAYGFEDGQFLPTWKAAPWAFADRVWLVYLPINPTTLAEAKPVLHLNGKEIAMTPRVRTEPPARKVRPPQWTVPMWFADITELCHYGVKNEVTLSGLKEGQPGTCFVTGSGGEKTIP